MSFIDIHTATTSFSLRSIARQLQTRLLLWQTRSVLAQLDSDQLKDIGLSAEDAQREAQMTVWNLPANWARR